jgi:hypothetical protein
MVQLDESDARLELDGRLLAERSAGGRFEVAESGAHELVVTAAHRRPFRQKVDLRSGVIVEVPVTLERLAPPPPRPPRPSAHPQERPTPPSRLLNHKRGDHDYMVDPFASPTK